ncbi:MAG: hypothetical protein HYU87_02400 [Chloroflexi bacterium]|nr:hypothetical protein [Chloroflexota bacterium]
MLRLVIATAALVTLSCGVLQDRETAEKAVDRFHELFNEASYSVIYNEADPEFRRSTRVPDFDGLLRSAQRSLGALQQARRTSSQVDGSTVSLTYESDFAKGKATERFAFAIRDGRAYLLSYDLRSPTLVVR